MKNLLATVFLLMILAPSFAEYGEAGWHLAGSVGFGDQIAFGATKIGVGFDEIGVLDLDIQGVFLIPYEYFGVGILLEVYPFKYVVLQNRVNSFFLKGKHQYFAYSLGLGLGGIKLGDLTVQFVAGYSLVRTHKEIDDPFGFFFELSFLKFYPFNEAIE